LHRNSNMNSRYRVGGRAAMALIGLALTLPGSANAGSIDAGTIVSARENHAAVVLPDGDVLLIGGVFSQEGFRGDEIERYDVATQRWTSARRSPFTLEAVGERGALLLAGTGKVVVSGNFVETLFEYDPEADSWVTLGNSSRSHAFAEMYERLPGEVMLVGGLRSGGFTDFDVPTFDTITRTRNAALSRTFRSGISVRLNDGRIFATGGFTSSATQDHIPAIYSEVFSIPTDPWRAFGEPRFPDHLVTLADGRVLALGGAPDPLATQLFDPATQQWSTRRPMLAVRSRAAVTRLADGRIMVSGGLGQSFLAEADVQIYDPATDRWSWSVPMPEPRTSHTVTVLADGSALIAGGGARLTRTWRYTPEPFDDDDDLVANNRDNCPADANADQADTDRDGQGDACDADLDGDGAANANDNCATIANVDQADLDRDGQGDACDADLDGDGAANANDNCATIANPDQADSDRDGQGNACDATPGLPGPDRPATDRDEGGCSSSRSGGLGLALLLVAGGWLATRRSALRGRESRRCGSCPPPRFGADPSAQSLVAYERTTSHRSPRFT